MSLFGTIILTILERQLPPPITLPSESKLVNKLDIHIRDNTFMFTNSSEVIDLKDY